MLNADGFLVSGLVEKLCLAGGSKRSQMRGARWSTSEDVHMSVRWSETGYEPYEADRLFQPPPMGRRHRPCLLHPNG